MDDIGNSANGGKAAKSNNTNDNEYKLKIKEEEQLWLTEKCIRIETSTKKMAELC